jgi:hypothetical protein
MTCASGLSETAKGHAPMPSNAGALWLAACSRHIGGSPSETSGTWPTSRLACGPGRRWHLLPQSRQSTPASC